MASYLIKQFSKRATFFDMLFKYRRHATTPGPFMRLLAHLYLVFGCNFSALFGTGFSFGRGFFGPTALAGAPFLTTDRECPLAISPILIHHCFELF